MAGVGRSHNLATLFQRVDGTHVVVPKLDEHIVAFLKRVIHLVPTALVQITAQRTAGHGGIGHRNLLGVERLVGHGTPAPHSVFLLVGVLHRGIAGEPYHGLSLLAVHLHTGQFHVAQQCLQRLDGRMVAGGNAFGCRAGVQFSTELRGVDVIRKEMVVAFPHRIALQFLG